MYLIGTDGSVYCEQPFSRQKGPLLNTPDAIQPHPNGKYRDLNQIVVRVSVKTGNEKAQINDSAER